MLIGVDTVEVPWHLMDLGIGHANIKKGAPKLNGKVERTLRTDDGEFYQLLSFKDDMDLENKLKTRERFNNLHRPHRAHDGKTPYEVLKEKLKVLLPVIVNRGY
ncbi:MAG: transposase [Spirochaetes bacterium]|nr:transposase [Spirochaetota bacterium]